METALRAEGLNPKPNPKNLARQKMERIGFFAEIETRKIIAGYSQDTRVKSNLYQQTWQVCENILHRKNTVTPSHTIHEVNEITAEKTIISDLVAGKIAIESIPVMTGESRKPKKEMATQMSLAAVAGTVDRLAKKRNEDNALDLMGFETPADTYSALVHEVDKYGLQTVRAYYDLVDRLGKVVDPQEARRLYQAMKALPLVDETKRAIFEKRISKIVEVATGLGPMNLAQPTTKTVEKRRSPNQHRRKEADQYLLSLNSAIRHLRYCYGKEELGPSPKVAEASIKALVSARNKISEVVNSMANCYELATLFWPIRLGREYPQNAEFAGFISDRDFSKYRERIADRRLRTDAAGFLFMAEKQIGQAHVLNPSQALVEYVDQLIGLEKKINPRDLAQKSGRMRFTVLANDSVSIKLDIDTTQEDCQKQIISALKNRANYRGITLSADQRAKLRLTTYSVFKDKDQLYRDFYGYGVKKKFLFFERKKQELGGDYIINLQLPIDGQGMPRYKTNDLLAPESLFSVDHHKGCLLVDLRTAKPGQIQPDRVAIKYNHQVFDGQPAKDHFTKMIKAITAQDEQTTRISAINIDLLAQSKPQTVEKRRSETYPLAEAFATTTVDGNYRKFTMEQDGQKISISPTLTRSLAVALANNVVDFHLLSAAEKNPCKDFGPVDNIQPIIVSLRPLASAIEGKRSIEEQKAALAEWLAYYDEARNWARQGLSFPGVLSAPTGRAEKQLYFISKIFHRGVKLLRESGGMFSPVPNLHADANAVNLVFATAQSDVYGESVNLMAKKVAANMGVIGYSQETKEMAIYVVRKLPRHAQRAFRYFVEEQLYEGPKSPIFRKLRVTLAIRQINKLVDAWDKLIVGEVDLSKYRKVRQQVFENLTAESVCGIARLEKNGITDTNSLQQSLNQILQRDAESTVNAQTIQEARQQIESLYRRCGFVEATK